MNIYIVEVHSSEQVAQVAQIATQVWHEYYSKILSAKQIDYMVAKFQSEEAIAAQIAEDGYRYYLLEVNKEENAPEVAQVEKAGEKSADDFCSGKEYQEKEKKICRENAGYFAICPDGKTLFLSKFYILERFRGRGVASVGFEFMEQAAKMEGLESIWLTVNKGNDNSIAVYNHKGFVTVREQVADIGCGYVMDDYVMSKSL